MCSVPQSDLAQCFSRLVMIAVVCSFVQPLTPQAPDPGPSGIKFPISHGPNGQGRRAVCQEVLCVQAQVATVRTHDAKRGRVIHGD